MSWGAKKEVSLAENLHVGDIVVVLNYGTHWQHQAQLVSIDIENNTIKIIWDTTRRKDTVELMDLTKYNMNDIGLRKRKATNFFVPLPNQKIASIRSLEHGLDISVTRIKNK